ncbi:MAG: hypothetical protein ACTSU7_07225 [Candidatus Heimdallarchaeaceae archaeon]
MSSFWDYPEEVREASKDSFENRVELILKEKSSIHLDDLLKLMWGGYNLLTNFQGILEGLTHLVNDGKIIMKEKIISLATITVFEDGEFKEKTVWDLLHREEEIEEKKEIIRRYNQINSLA